MNTTTAPCSACRREAWDTTWIAVVLDPAHVDAARLRRHEVRATVAEARALLAPVARRVLRAGVPICDVCVLGSAIV
jgi:hypothetical protein